MFRIALVFIFTSLSLASSAQEELTEDTLRLKTEAFIAAKNARQQPDTKIKDIEHFLSLISDDFKDEHIKFNVTVTSKNELRRGMIAKLKDEIDFSEIKIEQMMFGKNIGIVKYTERARVKPSHLDKFIEYTSSNIITLEFDEKGLIKHIRRHHGL